MHGGKAPQALMAAETRQQLERARQEIVRLGIPLESDPLDVLLNQVYEAAGNVAFLRRKVQELDCLWYSFKSGATKDGEDWIEIVEVKPHVLVQLYNAERDRLTRMAKLCLEAGVAERQVHLAEKQGALIADVIRRLLEDPELGLNAKQRQKGLAVASRHLRLVT